MPARAATKTRRALLWAAGVLGALVLALLLAESAGWPFLRTPLQGAMQRAAGVPVTLAGDFQLRLLRSPQLRVGRLHVGAASGVQVPHLVEGEDVELAWRWRDVWRWQYGDGLLRLRRLHAGKLDAHLVRGADGRASWQLGPPKTAAASDDDGSGLPRIASLAVRNGRIAVDDRPLETRLLVLMQGREGAGGAAAGYTATATGTYRALPLKLQVRAAAVLPLLQDADEELQPVAVPVRVEGEAGESRLLFDGSAAALLGAWHIDGKLRFRGPSLARVGKPLGLTLPHTAPFDIAGHLSQGLGVWHLHADHAAVGRSRLAGDFRYDTRTTPPRLTGRLSGPLLALVDLGPAVGAPVPGQAGTPKPAAARVLPQRDFDLPSLRAMDADLRVAIDEFDLGSEALAPLRNLRTQVLLAGGVLRLQELKAVVAGGQVSGSTLLDGRADAALWGADLRFRGVDVAGWIRGLQAPAAAASAPSARAGRALKAERQAARQGGNQPVRAYLTGVLAADVKVSGRGRSTADILGSLQGTAELSLQEGTLSHLVTEAMGLDAAQALGVVIRGDQPLPLRCARIDLQVAQGVAVPRLAVLDNKDSTLRIDGRIDLRDESLALRATTRPKDFSPLSLRTPLTVTGTLAHPVVGIDGRRLAGRVLAAAALAAVAAPVAALVPFVDLGSQKGADPCVTPAAAPAASAAARQSPLQKRDR